ncbi:MAG: hypothetical protein HRU29_03510 [Rhizobiales bacterium]|nr:hypothetical protein [Hyphomicrobiales bacterium]NRB13446.1 hypothetical protein [Hyphomicrobiales bacterium]
MWAGIIGVIIGSFLQIFVNFVAHKIKTNNNRELDRKRKKMLTQMLDNPGPKGWRTMKTLSSVIGANREETARLLIELDARASETKNDSWGYIKVHSLDKTEN